MKQMEMQNLKKASVNFEYESYEFWGASFSESWPLTPKKLNYFHMLVGITSMSYIRSWGAWCNWGRHINQPFVWITSQTYVLANSGSLS